MNENILKKSLVLFFSDLVGYTSLSEKRKPEEVFLILKEIYKICEEIIKKNGGKVVSYIGDAIFAVFGYPEVSPRDFEKMIISCVQINEILKKNFNILIKFSVHFDEVETDIDETGNLIVSGKGVDFVKDINKFSSSEKILVSENVYKILKEKYPFGVLKKINLYNRDFYVYEINLKEIEEKDTYISSLIEIEEKKKRYFESYKTSHSFEEIFEAGIGLIYFFIREGNFYSAYSMIQELMKVVKDNSLEKVKLLNSLAWLYYITGRINEGKNKIEEALKLFEIIDENEESKKVFLMTKNFSGLFFYRLGDYFSAKLNYTECIKKAKIIGGERFFTPYLTNLGNTYFQMGEFLKSEACHRYSYKLKEKNKMYINLPATLISYANLLIEMGNFKEAEKLLEKAEKIINDYSLRIQQIFYYYTLGNFFFLKENGGIEYYQKALSTCSEINYSFPVPMVLAGIGIYNSYHLKNKERTFKIIEKALNLSSEQNNFEYFILSKLALLYALVRFNEKFDEELININQMICKKHHLRFIPELKEISKMDDNYRDFKILKYKKNLIIKL